MGSIPTPGTENKAMSEAHRVMFAEDRRFIEMSLEDLGAPDSALQDPSIELALRAALRGEGTMTGAAESLLSGIRKACIESVMLGLEDHAGAETTPLESFADRPLREMGGSPPWIVEFLRLHPDVDWSATEVITREDPTLPLRFTGFDGRVRSGSILNLMGVDHLYGNRELFEWMHPPGSRIVRLLPLHCLLWDEARRAGDGGVAIRFTARPSSFDTVRRSSFSSARIARSASMSRRSSSCSFSSSIRENFVSRRSGMSRM